MPTPAERAANQARNARLEGMHERFMAVVESDATDKEREAAWAVRWREAGNLGTPRPMPAKYLLGGPYHAEWLELEGERRGGQRV
jgi:hypothetical protein